MKYLSYIMFQYLVVFSVLTAEEKPVVDEQILRCEDCDNLVACRDCD